MNNPLQVKDLDPQVTDYLKGKAKRPDQAKAADALITFARNTNIKNNIMRRDIVDAMIRQVKSNATIPFSPHIISQDKIVFASDYDMGRSGVAYHDRDSAEYWVSTSRRTPWNSGGLYRNDGVDIEKCLDTISNGYNVGWTESGEWLQYSVYVPEEGAFDIKIRAASEKTGGSIRLLINDRVEGNVSLPQTSNNQSWKTSTVKNIKLAKGINKIKLWISQGGFNLNYFQFIQTSTAKHN